MDWIVIVNQRHALIYKEVGYGEIIPLWEYINPLGQLKNKEMQYDKPGQSRAKNIGSAPHNLVSKTTPIENSTNRFIKNISRFLINELEKDKLLSITLVSGSKLLGSFKTYFQKSGIKTRVFWIEKNLQNTPQKKWPHLLGLKRRNCSAIKSHFPI